MNVISKNLSLMSLMTYYFALFSDHFIRNHKEHFQIIGTFAQKTTLLNLHSILTEFTLKKT